jgi:hypothetical protein
MRPPLAARRPFPGSLAADPADSGAQLAQALGFRPLPNAIAGSGAWLHNKLRLHCRERSGHPL